MNILRLFFNYCALMCLSTSIAFSAGGGKPPKKPSKHSQARKSTGNSAGKKERQPGIGRRHQERLLNTRPAYPTYPNTTGLTDEQADAAIAQYNAAMRDFERERFERERDARELDLQELEDQTTDEMNANPVVQAIQDTRFDPALFDEAITENAAEVTPAILIYGLGLNNAHPEQVQATLAQHRNHPVIGPMVNWMLVDYRTQMAAPTADAATTADNRYLRIDAFHAAIIGAAEHNLVAFLREGELLRGIAPRLERGEHVPAFDAIRAAFRIATDLGHEGILDLFNQAGLTGYMQ